MRKPILTPEEITAHKSNCNGNPSIYCGTYAKYNNGSLYGMWIDLTTFCDYEEFIEFCNALHADEADPELMFQDYEEYPEELYSESFMEEETFNKIIAYSECSDKDQADAFIDLFGIDAFEDEDSVNENYYGYFETYEDLGRECAESMCLNIPDDIECYFDYERYGRDCAYDFSEFNNYYWFKH